MTETITETGKRLAAEAERQGKGSVPSDAQLETIARIIVAFRREQARKLAKTKAAKK